MTSRTNSGHFTSPLILKLACYILKKSPEEVKAEYRSAVQILNCCYPKPDIDELSVCEKIRKKIIQENKIKDALTFNELHRKLQTTSLLKYRANIFYFLYCLYGFELEASICSSENVNISINELDMLLSSSDYINYRENIDFPQNRNDIQVKESWLKYNEHLSRDRLLKKNTVDIIQNNCMDLPHGVIDVKSLKKTVMTKAFAGSTFPNLKLLLKDVLYCIQGFKGSIINWEPEKGNFNVEFNKDFSTPIKKIILRFLEQGWLYCKINNYCIAQSNDRSLGLIAQSFVAALKQKLVDYYKLITELESFLNQDSILEHLQNGSHFLTVHRMTVWMFEPSVELKLLASVVDACKGKKGGALVSVLYSYLQHGDQFVRALIQNLLQEVTRPLFRMLSNWIYRGELEDVFGEFFVATNVSVPDGALWQEKYNLNKMMIPSFITMEQARKILSTGKAINFLHQVCHENTYSKGIDQRIKALELLSTESLFSQEKDANFESILEKNYAKTGKTVLRILHDKYNLMDHLLAMRNYFLLGQGDFIRHLMDLLEVDLNKPGKSLFIPDLSGILESAIRATNAQFYNPEVLQKLDVRLLDVSVEDTGWDVFTLEYRVNGPLGTVFTGHCMSSYLKLFRALWQAKRMEYILSKISHSRTVYLKLEAKIAEVTPVLYHCNLILSQMVHFVQQMQYYMAFEVMECCWADLLLKISSAQDLDEVITAHDNFLKNLLTRALLDDDSVAIRTELQGIYGFIIDFDQIQSSFWADVQSAVQKLDEMEEVTQANTNNEKWGITEDKLKGYMDLKNRLITNDIPQIKSSLRILFHSYEEAVQRFLIQLYDKADTNLHFLSLRLDFNEYFKCKNSRLQSSLTFQHRRKSLGVKK